MSTERKMSSSLIPSQVAEISRGSWGRLFGHFIVSAHQKAGLSVEQAAVLASMEISEWMAVEEGCVPQDINQLHAMADAMGIRFEQVASLVMLCSRAWEV